MEAFWGGATVLLSIIFFVTAHEAGHFLAAKATGMKATEFFFGFGPKLASFKKGETEYGFKAIPLGGYVRIAGMNPLEEITPEDIGRTYREKKFWQKSVVVLAGVGTNFLIAYLMFAGINLAAGSEMLTTTIDQVVVETESGERSPASLIGLRKGDVIVATNGKSVTEWSQVATFLVDHPNEEVSLSVLRGNERLQFDVTLATRQTESGEQLGFLGVSSMIEHVDLSVWDSLGLAGRQIAGTTAFAFDSIGRLVAPSSLRELFGVLLGDTDIPPNIRPVSPIGMVNAGAQVGRIGWANLLFVLASTNVILGALNVIPLYPLDGGHFALALYQKLTKREPNLRKLMPVAVAVVALVMFLALVAVVLDISAPLEL